jgi:hypothetical protein
VVVVEDDGGRAVVEAGFRRIEGDHVAVSELDATATRAVRGDVDAGGHVCPALRA